MTNIEEADAWIGRTAMDNTGKQIGIITQIWVDDTSGQPEWATVKGTDLRGREALVPLAGAATFGGGRRFAYSKEDIVNAPGGGGDGRLEVADKERLSSHYGAPDTDPDPGSATWIDRMEDAADGATVREISGLLGEGHSAPPPRAPVARKAGRRFGRKPASSAPKAKRLFRRNPPPSDLQPAELAVHDGPFNEH